MSSSSTLLPGVTHFIPLNQAAEMTRLFRNERETILVPELRNKKILPICETFNREAFDFLLGENDCAGIRLYLGMDAELKVHLIAVGVNSKNEDILPTSGGSVSLNNGEGIVEDGQRCPDDCPPSSPLNT